MPPFGDAYVTKNAEKVSGEYTDVLVKLIRMAF